MIPIRSFVRTIVDAIRDPDRELLDRYVFFAMTVVFASFFVLAKDGRALFYLICLLPMTLYLRPSVLRDVASSWYWRLSLALCGLWIASIAWSTGATLERSYDAARIAVALGIFLTAGIAIARAGRLNQRFLLDAVSLTAGVTALLMLALSWDPEMYWAGTRLIGFGWAAHPGIGGDLYGFAGLIALVTALETSERKRWLVGVAIFLICIVTIVLTQSRGSLLALACALLVLSTVRHPVFIVGIGAVILGVTMIAHVAGALDVQNWLIRGSAGRFAIWKETIELIRAHPLLGAGAASPLKVAHHNSTHNVFLSVQYYMGVPGTLVYGALTLLVFIQAWRLAWRGKAVLLILLVYGYVVMQTHTQSIIIMLSREWLIFWLPLVMLSGPAARDGLLHTKERI